MTRPDHNTYREWLNLDVDGRLPQERRAEMDEHLAACAECRTERDRLCALEALLGQARAAVEPGFRGRVLAALPSAGWESRSPRTWAFPAAACALFAAIAAAVVGSGSPARGSSAVLSALAAVAGMFRATLTAGAGLLAASWKGLGMAFAALLSSPVSLGVFGVFVLCVNLGLISLLRRRRSLPADAVRREGGGRR